VAPSGVKKRKNTVESRAPVDRGLLIVATVLLYMQTDGGVAGFSWQAGYGAFSIGESQADTVIRYIQNQENHHRKMSFQDEFRKFLQRYRVAYDERYVWD